MRGPSRAESCLVAVSARLYQALLVCYPRAFRREFGPHMLQVFGDACRQAQGEGGALGILSLWIPLASDLAVSAVHEHLVEGVHMSHLPRLSRSVVVRAGGAAALLGGALLLYSFLFHPHGLARVAVPGSIACLIVGILGLHARLWGREGRLGAIGFILVGIGLVLGFIGMAGSAVGVLNPNPLAPIINTGEHAGLVFIGTGMSLWGIVSVRTKALGGWSLLPLVMGLLALTGIVFVNRGAFSAVEQSIVPLVFAACWIPLGFALLTWRDNREGINHNHLRQPLGSVSVTTLALMGTVALATVHDPDPGPHVLLVWAVASLAALLTVTQGAAASVRWRQFAWLAGFLAVGLVSILGLVVTFLIPTHPNWMLGGIRLADLINVAPFLPACAGVVGLVYSFFLRSPAAPAGPAMPGPNAA